MINLKNFQTESFFYFHCVPIIATLNPKLKLGQVRQAYIYCTQLSWICQKAKLNFAPERKCTYVYIQLYKFQLNQCRMNSQRSYSYGNTVFQQSTWYLVSLTLDSSKKGKNSPKNINWNLLKNHNYLNIIYTIYIYYHYISFQCFIFFVLFFISTVCQFCLAFVLPEPTNKPLRPNYSHFGSLGLLLATFLKKNEKKNQIFLAEKKANSSFLIFILRVHNDLKLYSETPTCA